MPASTALSFALGLNTPSSRPMARSPARHTAMLDNRNPAHLELAAELIAQGEIVAFGFDGVFAFIGDADQPIAARRMAQAKGQSADKPLALVCPPEDLDFFTDSSAPAWAHHSFGKVRQLQHALHGLGVILPAATRRLPHYAMQDGTVLNVWFELPPDSPARTLYRHLRALGVRTLIGTSANRHGEPTYVDPQHALRVFGGTIPAIVAHDLRTIPMHRRVSSTMVDFTGPVPTLARHGSVPVDELRQQMRVLGLAELAVPSTPVKGSPVAALH